MATTGKYGYKTGYNKASHKFYEMNLALKLSPKENYFTEELVGIL